MIISKRIFLVFFLTFFGGSVCAQVDTLVGMVDGELIKIHLGDAGVTDELVISGFPITYDPYRLTWCEASNCYFGLALSVLPSYATSIIRVTEAGDYSVIGLITVPGETVYFLESITWNRFDEKLYVSGSLNGAPPTDYSSETLIQLDTNTWEGVVIGTFFDLFPLESDGDHITFDEAGRLYYCDGRPGGGGFLRFFEQNLDFITAPELIYTSGYYPTSDLTVRDDILYFSGNRILRQIDLITDVYSIVGTMFTALDYSGALLRGVTWKPVCEPDDPDFSYLATTYCYNDDPVFPDMIATAGGEFSSSPAGLLIDLTTGELTALGSEPGDYEITYSIIADCPISATFDITIGEEPIVDAIADITVCDGELIEDILFTGGVDVVFDWMNDNPTIGLGISGVGDISSFTSIGAVFEVTSNITVTPYLDGCAGEPVVFTVTVNPIPANGFNYSELAYCPTDAAVLPSMIETPGGEFSAVPAGLSVDPVTGMLDPAASVSGIYDLTYSLGGDCPNDSTIIIEVLPLPFVNPIADIEFCQGDNVAEITIDGSVGGVFEWTNDNLLIGLGNSGTGNIPTFIALGGDFTELATITIVPSVDACIGNSETVVIAVHPNPDIDFMGDVLRGCEPLNVVFTAVGTDLAGTCAWSFGDGGIGIDCGSVNHTYNNSGFFDVTLSYTDLNGCFKSHIYPSYIEVLRRPVASFYPSSTTITDADLEVRFENTSLFADSYEWNFGDGSGISTTIHPNHLFGKADFEVQLVAFSEGLLCTDTIKQLITYQEQILIYVPNTFSPDGDNFNNTFTPVIASGVDPYDFHMAIYNRWGELIFETFDLTEGWKGTYGVNGKLAEDGIYIWQIQFGELANSDEKHEYTGHVTILK